MTRNKSLYNKLAAMMSVKAIGRTSLEEISNEVTIEVVLTRIAEELWREVPTESFGHVLIVYVPGVFVPAVGFVQLENGIRIPVRFDPSEDNHPHGSVVIGYSQGNLESARGGIGGLGWLADSEP